MIGQIPKSPANPFFRMSGCDFEPARLRKFSLAGGNPDILSERSESKDCRDLKV
jgi:hypothetical protein